MLRKNFQLEHIIIKNVEVTDIPWDWYLNVFSEQDNGKFS